jgi:hypothetical protein
MFKGINWKVFLLAFTIGIIFICVSNEKRVIVVFPTPDNKDQIQYKDDADNCFNIEPYEVDCEIHKSMDYDIQD